ncbi:MAG: GH1 family beta-glucosidase [bacterium]
MKTLKFPDKFTWGVAAASYQIEGAVNEGGRGQSVWDAFCRWDGKIWNGDSGDVACDHYHRYREDVALMRDIGVRAYRLSVAWPRVIPAGTGAVNPEGLGFYDRLVDSLLEAGITPWVTLFHWDYPLDLFHRGGWLNRDSVEWFADYTKVVVDRLSDRVQNWMTLNEPQCFVWLGHGIGTHAPGLQLPPASLLRVAHHALMAHGRAVQVIRASAKTKPTVGWAPVGVIRYPATDKPEDLDAARRSMHGMTSAHLWTNTWFSDPVILGHYPEDGLKLFGKAVPKFPASDLEVMKQPLDFYGANIYNALGVRAGANGQIEEVKREAGSPVSLYHWPVEPASLYWGPRLLQERYKLPIVITENGMATHDWISRDGKVHDPQRIDFLSRYLEQLHRAISDGVDVRAFFHWSILDNFEWNEGCKHRFGLAFVDYPTQRRVLKDSAYWYRDVMAGNALQID